MGYGEALRLQEQLRQECIEAGGGRGFLLMVEHDPVITIGLSGLRSDVLAADERLARLGVSIANTNRGGQVTFHGPGQLVAYPIINLDARGRSLHGYLRDLESWLVRLCRSFGVPAHADSPHTGVWVGDRKVASIGIAARRWVTYHGVALNVTTDLSFFDLIVPCGLNGLTTTSLELELGTAPAMADVAARAAAFFGEDFGMAVESTSPEAART
jgi:lipoate-protein ligase B